MPREPREYIPVTEDWRVCHTAEHEWTAYHRRTHKLKKDGKRGRAGEEVEEWVESYHSSLLGCLKSISERDISAANSLEGVIARINTMEQNIKVILENQP